MTNLSDWRAGRSLKIAAVAAAFIFTCIALAVTPIADLPLTRSMIGFAVLMTWSATALGLTSLFLNAQTRGNRLYAQAVLAIGYGFAALMMIPYDVFSPGMFGDLSARLRMQPHGTEWLNLLWHFGLIAGVVGYHLINWAHPSGVYWSGGRRVVGRIFSASCWLFFVSIFVALWWPLPALVIDGHLAALSRFILIPALMAFAFVAMLMPVYKRRMGIVLDLCLSLVCLATILDLYLMAMGESRFSLGWYLSRGYVVGVAMSVIAVLLWQSAMMYADLSLMAKRFQDEAHHDKLTGLANRRHFDEAITTMLAKAIRRGGSLAFAFADIDRFKHYNDVYGHLAGDACLQRVASAISSTLRPTDFVARYGGEEFVIVLDDTDTATAAEVFERVRSAVPQAMGPPEHREVTISIGVTMLHGEEDTAKLIGRADSALYAAKSAGRNRVVFTEDLYRARAAS